MTRGVRLGAVGYLNARPLVYGLESQAAIADVRFDVPAVCADLLAAGQIDLGLVPSISYLDRPGDRVIPGVAIASYGPVASVALYARRPIREARTIALDTSSRTSAALTRVLCARRFAIEPTFVPHVPDLGTMLETCDAALLIGDPALFVDHRAFDAEKIDLGEEWRSLTGLPFVWAVWAGPPDAAGAAVVEALNHARDQGVAGSDSIADAYCEGDPARQRIARDYLRGNMKYDLSADALEGLRTYYAEAAALGLVSGGAIRFF